MGIVKQSENERIVSVIRQSFCELPPKAFLMQVIDPTSRLYVFLWERRDDFNKIILSWNEIGLHYNKNHFRTCLRKLNNAGLVTDFKESPFDISIEVIGWDNFEE